MSVHEEEVDDEEVNLNVALLVKQKCNHTNLC